MPDQDPHTVAAQFHTHVKAVCPPGVSYEIIDHHGAPAVLVGGRQAVTQARRQLSLLDSVVAGVFTVPGDGMVDFAAVLAELPGYDGWLVVEAEQDPALAHPLTYAKLGHDKLVGFASQVGLL